MIMKSVRLMFASLEHGLNVDVVVEVRVCMCVRKGLDPPSNMIKIGFKYAVARCLFVKVVTLY